MLKPREAGVRWSAGGWLPLDATPRPPDVTVERVAASAAPAAASGTTGTAALHLADDVTVVQSQLAHAHSRAHTHARTLAVLIDVRLAAECAPAAHVG